MLSRNTKISIVFLVSSIGLCTLLLIGKVGADGIRNQQIIKQIAFIRGITDKTILVKQYDYGDERSNAHKLNLNKANIASLKLIPGIRRALAKNIANYVKQNNGVKSLRELLDVKGITPKKLGRLSNYITVLGGHAGKNAWGHKLNLNFVNADDLKKLDGLSSKLAQKIIEFRDSNGGFFSIEDLKEIPGITEAKFNRFADKIEVK